MKVRSPAAPWVRHVLVAMLLGAALVTGGGPAWRWGKRAWHQVMEERLHQRWVAERPERLRKGGAPESGETVGWLNIPSCGIGSLVAFDATEQNLKGQPCLHRLSLAPGSPVLIMAHRDTHFRGLKDLQPGQTVTFETDRLNTPYRVTHSQIVNPEQIPELLSGRPAGELILLTCWPIHFHGEAPQRIAFFAEPL